MRTGLISVILIIILGFGVYVNSLDNPFIWDDTSLIVNNNYIKQLSNIPDFFTKNITYASHLESNHYRPLQVLTYTLNYHMGKLDPRIYHLFNIIFHIGCALLLYWLAILLFKNKFVALLAGLLFVSHPIHTEAVTYIAGRADSMVLLFMCLALVYYIKYSSGENRTFFYTLSVIAYLLALLCKETALVIPLLLFAYDRIYKERGSAPLGRLLPFFFIAALYIVLRNTVLNFPTENTVVNVTLYQRMPVIFSSLTMYFKKLVLPLGLHMDYMAVVPLINDPEVIASMAIIFILITAAVVFRKKEKAVTFSIVWFLINYLPISNIYPLSTFFAEHWIYAPSVGLFMLAGWVVFRIGERGRPVKAFTVLAVLSVLVGNSYLTVQQNLLWKNPEAFYNKILQFNPTSARVYTNLANIYFDKGEYEKAIGLYNNAIKINPSYMIAYYNLGIINTKLGKTDQAIAAYEKALELRPDLILIYQNLANLYYQTGRQEEALALLRRIKP